MSLEDSAAGRLVAAVAARDVDAIKETLALDARFRYLIPPGPGEVAGAAEVAAKFLEWFGDVDVLNVSSSLVEPIADRISVKYRFRIPAGQVSEIIEQQAYLDLDEDGRIAAMDLVCSGFRPAGSGADDTEAARHRFDAGDLGCADGLAREFRRRILAIPLGDVLAIQTSDPAAKEDLPPLARLMGHKVLSVEPSGEERHLITVERGR